MELRLLGSLEARTAQGQVVLRRQKQRALLAALALRAGEVVSLDRLVEDLWGEEPPRAAVGSLQNLVWELRKLLGPDVLVTRPPGYLLAVERDEVDVHRFARLVAEARGAAHAEARASLLREALGLWRGAALADLAFEPFAGVEVSRLEELRMAAREDLADAELRLGRHGEVIDQLEGIVAEQPFRERPRALLMLALYRAGRQADALEAFAAARRFLRDELGLEPSPALQKLQGAILRQDPALDPPSPRRIAGLPAEERRKTVTVAYTDVVDSTALGAELDPEAYRGVLRRYGRAVRAVFERHGGTVEKFIGDAVVAVFGVPEQHEDDALRAVRAAVELRERLAELNAELAQAHSVTIEIRVGINTGEAIASTEDSAQSFATGFAVNVGAKLQQAAGPGGILVGAATYRLVRDAVVAEPGEPLTLGRTTLPTFRILDLATGREAVARHVGTPLVGREEEFVALSHLFAEARDVQACRLATVIGEAGIGKSRLARELAATVDDEATVLVGRCVSYGEGATYLPVAEIIRRLVADGSEAGIAGLLGDDKDARLIARRVRELLGWAEGTPPAGEGFWAVRRLLEAVAGPKPVLLVLEDVHWAEPTLLDLVEHLVAQSHKVPILVLCLARPELVDARPSWPVTVRLAPLSGDASAELVANLAGDVSDALRARIVEIAEGNALFAEQLLAYALEGGEEALETVPGSVEALLASRLDRLPENERSVLERAAVVGREFWRGAVAELSERDVTAELQALAAKVLVNQTRSLLTGEDALSFHHVLIRDVAYGGITKERRSKLHERVAAWLDMREPGWDEIIGYHLEQAYACRRGLGRVDADTEALGERAGARLGHAGLRAWKRTDTPSATNLIGRAVALLPDGEQRAELLAELALTHLTAGSPEAREAFEQALALASRLRSRRLELRLRLDMAAAGMVGSADLESSPEEVLAIAAEALPVFEKTGDDRSLGRAWLAIASAHSNRVHNVAWEKAAAKAFTYYRRAGWPGASCLMGQAAALYWGPTAVPEALRRAEQLREASETDAWARASIDVFRAGLVAMDGRVGHAREVMSDARRVFEELAGVVQIAINWSGMAAEIARLEGDLGEAEALLRGSLETVARAAHGYAATRAIQLAEVLCERSAYEEARDLVTDAERRLVTGDLIAHVRWRAVKARILVEDDEVAAAEAFAREAHDWMRQTDAVNQQARVALNLAYVLRRRDASDEAEAMTQQAVRLFQKKGNAVEASRAQTYEVEAFPK